MSGPAVLVAAVTLVLGLSACSGGSDESAATPEPASSPTETTPAGPPPQPEGADGVTFEVENWEDYHDDEAAVAWKQINEAISASINEGRLLPEVRDRMTEDAIRPYLRSAEYAWDNDFVVPELTYGNIVSVETSSDEAVVIGCTWLPSVVLYQPDGDPVGEAPAKEWSREEMIFSVSEDELVVESVDLYGTCPGEPPSS